MAHPTPRSRYLAIGLGIASAVVVLGVLPRIYERIREVPADRIHAQNQSKAGVLAVLESQSRAWNDGDLDGYMEGYWDSPELEFISGTTTTHGFQPVKERYHKRYKAAGQEMGHLTFDNLAVELTSDTTATVTGLWEVRKAKETLSGGFTVELRLFENGWKVVRDTTTSNEPPKKE